MNSAIIKDLRYEKELEQLVKEAMSSLEDKSLCFLDPLAVKISKGRHDCFIYLDPSDYTTEQMQEILQKLKKARSYIQELIFASSNRFKVPKLSFVFDASIKQGAKIDALLEKIANERTTN